MLNVIADIGKIVSGNSQGELLDFLIPETAKQRYIVGIDFNLAKKSLAFNLLAEGGENGLSKQKLQEYLFVASERGNRPQFSPTTTNLGYLVSQTLPNLVKTGFLPEDSELKKLLQKVRDRFFVEVQEEGGNKPTFILNEKLIPNASFHFAKKPEKLKDAIGAYAKALAGLIAEKTTAPAKETIYTVCVDGEPVAAHPDYQRFLWQQNSESAFDGGFSGTCSICGTETEVTQDTTRFVMKFYMTDKVSFASHFDEKNYYKAVTACKSCYQNIIIAEKWIDQNLRTRLGGFDVYVMPQMIWTEMEAIRLFRYLQAITREFNEVKNIASLREAERKAAERAERMGVFEQNAFIWNFLFFRKAQSAFKVLALIKDVPPSRIMEITKRTHETDDGRKKLEIPDHIVFDLDQIYRLIPLRRDKKKGFLEYKKVLQLYACIFSGLPMRKEQLYNYYKQLACMHHFESYGLYLFKKPNNPDYALMADTLKWNLFLLFLQKLKIIEGESTMITNEYDAYFPNGVKAAFAELNYNEAQQGLALLGYVIGVIAYVQSEKENLKSKPILDKINYQGMSEEKVMRLFNEASQKIHQYRRHIGYAERWLALGKKLYETGAREELTADARVFYLLSGYSMNLLRTKPTAEITETEEAGSLEEEEEVA
ncbi:MAG: TIGR02556 family CRISPR-associated protein [candidate division KSB1 bacterium]|nr:TIGR02556 family CRISPR-associated protein [candidate division KSB1 bacterium]MDZ7364247.1 TIGR02556 family CRISPR-associated protein [candidate division KSB1 bacterium]MDZ7404970.1 TIGR02556 family CRISPR-associated protein [candidate division KSB1 bacterium]